MKRFLQLSVLLGNVVAAVLLLVAFPEILPPEEKKAAILALLTISFWATGVIPEHLTALLFFLLAMLFSVAPANVVFAGFASTAVWLVFSGLIIGIAISSTGLGKRIADLTAAGLQGSYTRILIGLTLAGTCFSFLMPSAMGRVVLLTPIALSVAEHFGFDHGSKGRTGIVLAIILGTFIPAFGILPANVPNMILAGMAETQYQVTLLYGPYLLLHFPLLTAAKSVLISGLLLFFFPDTLHRQQATEKKSTAPMTAKEKILAVVIACMLLLWMTDFAHHISPAWIALAGALFLLFPGIEIVTAKQFNQKINWGSLFFIAGILGLGGMINHTGLGHTLAQGLLSLFPLSGDHPFGNYLSISLASALTGLLTTLPGIPAVFTPLSDTIATTTGLSIKTILMMQVLGFSTVLLPYQAPPIVIGLQLAGEKFSSAARVCLALAAITILLLLPFNYLWWKLLGYL